MTSRLLVLSLFLSPCVLLAEEKTASLPKVAENDWPWWRGPSLDGISRDQKAATKWGKDDNIVWKTRVPGKGHSSPVVWGDRVFLTTSDEQEQTQSVLTFDRKEGKPLWNVVAYKGGFLRKYPKNTHASATSACDGERLYSAFINNDGLHVIATDLVGKVLWRKEAGAYKSEHGYGSSPVLWKSLVIVNGDSLKGCFLAALDRETGKVVWMTERKTTGKHGSYATPLVATLSGKPQLIMTGMHGVASYDPNDGKLIWSCDGPAEVTANTPAVGDNVVFVSGGYPEKNLLALRTDGKGDVTKSHIGWSEKTGVAYVPSPLYHEGRLYVINDQGVATCFDAKDGKPVWRDRIEGPFSSSPVLVGNLLYIINEFGNTTILKTGPKFEVVGTNDLGDGGFATPAICGGKIYLRTSQYLYCIGK